MEYFVLTHLLDQLAVSAGWGLRWILTLFCGTARFCVFGTDTVFAGRGKMDRKFEFWKPTINIAIGYPF